jgi:F-type H+-transporting ATPase subunit epsilon
MSLDLEILVPDGVVTRARVTALQAADASGRFGLLPGHEAFLTLLAPCVLSYRDGQGQEVYVAVDGGVLLLERDRVKVVSREAVTAARLEEVADAAAAMLEARRQREHLARVEFAELQTTLLRELREVQRQK